jgi:hypothetical protein
MRLHTHCLDIEEPAKDAKRVSLRLGSGQDSVTLEFPRKWTVRVLWPRAIPPLSWTEISASFERSYGQPTIRQLVRTALRPLVVVDNPLGSAPVARLMPVLLDHFRQAGVPATAVRFLVACGGGGPPVPDFAERAVGPEVASSCRVLLHDPDGDSVVAGYTSRGTRIEVNRELLLSDFIVGVGGAFPNHMDNFAGGLSLLPGVLSTRSLRLLHEKNQESELGHQAPHSEFRRETDEIARLIGLKTAVCMMMNADREIVRVFCGDPLLYDQEASRFASETYRAPAPHSAVGCVVSNACPGGLPPLLGRANALSLLLKCPARASRVLVGSGVSEAHAQARDFLGDRLRMRWVQRAFQCLARKKDRRHPIRVYSPGNSWRAIVDAVSAEQGDQAVEVWVYPSASLQILELQRPCAGFSG